MAEVSTEWILQVPRKALQAAYIERSSFQSVCAVAMQEFLFFFGHKW